MDEETYVIDAMVRYLNKRAEDTAKAARRGR